MFSKACEYGIRAATYIALQSIKGRRVSLREIAEKINSPLAFTAKILQQLARNGIVDSVKGARGGYVINKQCLDQVSLKQIVQAIDGEQIFKRCGLGLSSCNAEIPCPVHDKFTRLRNDLRVMMDSTSLYEMTLGLDSGLTFLKR